MVTIKTQFGTFEGETIDEASRAAKVGEREHQKAQLARSKNYTTASERAKVAAYSLLVSVIKGEQLPRYDFCQVPKHSPGEVCSFDAETRTLIVETDDGRACVELFDAIPVGYCVKSNGFAVAVFIRDIYMSRTTGYTLGVSGDVVALAELPGVTVESFTGEPQ